MRYTLTITEQAHERLTSVVFADPDREGAAYLLCGTSVTAEETRLLVRDVVPVASEHYEARAWDRLSIRSASYAAVAKQAGRTGNSVVFVHSHPKEVPDFSARDDHEEQKLLAFLASRVPNRVHGSLVLPREDLPRGRVATPTGFLRFDRIRVLGKRFSFYDEALAVDPIPDFYDRQVRAFGPDIQRVLQRLHVGVVGAGGTGSAVIEQLTRLGVGTISVCDHDTFDKSNVNRVYGSGASDDGRLKVEITGDHVAAIGVGTELRRYAEPLTLERFAKLFRDCDLIFGCTDKQSPRGILVRLALWYLIPVFDVGVKIDSKDGVIRGIYGRVTTLLPGAACLFCRGRISADQIRLESAPVDERRRLADEGYAPELEEAAPAVITFTTAAAAQAVSELLHRLTGFMGSQRQSTETLLFFDQGVVRTNSTPAQADCLCMATNNWGKGDAGRDFLGLMWPDALGDRPAH